MTSKKYLISIDLSTKCTGWALFDIETEKLVSYGSITPDEKGISTLKYPKGALARIKRMVEQVTTLVNQHKDEIRYIAIEEINRGINRIAQKTLDSCHFFLLDSLESLIDIVIYRDSDGALGWRKQLKHVLTETDKEFNARVREANKKLPKKFHKEQLTRKHVTARWVNQKFGKVFDIDKNAGEEDICDAIGLGYATMQSLSKVK